MFSIGLHEKDRALLEKIKNFFSVGFLYKHGPQSIQYRVQSIKDFAIIIDHFDKYPLITQKRVDYELFKPAFDIIKNKEHLTSEGLIKIVEIRASLNRGLSEKLIETFANAVPIERPIVKEQIIKDSN